MAATTETVAYYHPFYLPHSRPVIVKHYPCTSSGKGRTSDTTASRRSNNYDRSIYTQRPIFGALLFDNTDSDARDHCANERTFLSWLRLSVYMAIVSVAIVISFHLKHQPTELEKRFSLPFGILFWFLALACLASGTANYFKTVAKYSRRQALVQSGWKTQVVFTVVATAIVAACVLFLSTGAETKR